MAKSKPTIPKPTVQVVREGFKPHAVWSIYKNGVFQRFFETEGPAQQFADALRKGKK